MKQGTAKNTYEPKTEPISHAVDVGVVSQIGCRVGPTPQQLYTGRGYEAPAATSTIHKTGSQGTR